MNEQVNVVLNLDVGNLPQAADKASKSIGKIGQASTISAGQTTQALRQLPAQFTDIFTSLQGGQNPFTVLIQQGGQIKDSFGGVGPALRGIASAISPVALAVGGASIAVGGLAAAYFEGQQQSAAFRTSIALTGNAAGITEGQYDKMAQTIAAATNTTIGSTREALQSLVSSGRFTGDALTAAGTAAQQLSKVTGKSSEEIVKDFITLAGGVSAGAQQLNQQYHFLTAAQLENIKTLDEQGRSQQAVTLTLEALNSRVGAAAKNVGTLEGAWRAAKNEVSGYVDAALKIGRGPTVDSEIERVSAQLAAAKSSLARNREAGGGLLNIFFGNIDQASIDRLTPLLDRLKQSKDLEQQVAKAQGEAAQREQARVQYNRLIEGSLSQQGRLAKELLNAYTVGTAAGKTPEEIAALQRDIVARNKGLTNEIAGLTKSNLAADVSAIQNQLQVLAGAYSRAEDALEQQRGANFISERQYYGTKRLLIEQDAAAQARGLEQENARLRASGLLGKDAIDTRRQIADNEAKIAVLRANASAKLAGLDVQETIAQRARTRAFEESRVAAQNYLDTLGRLQQQDLQDFGASDKQRSYAAGLRQIEDDYRSKRQQLESQKVSGAFDQRPEEYAAQLQLLQGTFNQALTGYETYYAKRQALEQDATIGAARALANYVDESKQAAKASEQLFSDSFHSIEDATVELLATGRLNFHSLINSILQEALRLKVVRPLLASIFSTGSSGGWAGLLGGIVGALGGTGATASLASSMPGDSLDNFLNLNSNFSPHKSGLDYVPYDGYKALLHQGERVQTASEARQQDAAGAAAQAQQPQMVFQVIVQGDVSANNVRLVNEGIKSLAAKNGLRV